MALIYALRSRRVPLRPGLILRPGRDTLRRFGKYSVPVVCNETLWGTGTSMLTVVMGHMAQSQDMLAAYSLMGNIDKLSTVICFGLAASAAGTEHRAACMQGDFHQCFPQRRRHAVSQQGHRTQRRIDPPLRHGAAGNLPHIKQYRKKAIFPGVCAGKVAFLHPIMRLKCCCLKNQKTNKLRSGTQGSFCRVPSARSWTASPS